MLEIQTHNSTSMIRGGLFINVLACEFEAKPRNFYFASLTTKLSRSVKMAFQTLPVEASAFFQELSTNDMVSTTFDFPEEGFKPIKVNLSNPENYYFAKQYYTRRLARYFRSCGLTVAPNAITHDCMVWRFNNNDNDKPNTWKYDRFTVKIDYDHFNGHPQLVLSYDRPSWVYNTSIDEIFNSIDDPFADTQPSASLFNWVLYRYNDKAKIDRYHYLSQKADFDSAYAYPVLNNKLISFLGLDADVDDEPDDQSPSFEKPKNKYLRYYDRINEFYKRYLDNDDFRSILDISTEGFSWVNPMQVGHTSPNSKQLLFGNNNIDYNPQKGLNKGPFEPSPYTNIQLVAIFPKEDRATAHQLANYFLHDYKGLFDGLKKYLGKDFSFSRRFLEIQDKSKIIEELDDFLASNANYFSQSNPNTRFLAVYLTPVGKHTSDANSKRIYYQVKQKLLKYHIDSQCIETAKMLAAIKKDEENESKGKPHKNFAYTLQNMALAMTAKLRGTPWRLAAPKQNELIVGVGAFCNVETDTQYIGSAFSFENTGKFNSFEFFQKDEVQELAGSIEEAIINFTKVNNKPGRLIIHYFKPMNKKEFALIDQTLQKLDIDIPVYVVTIGKTESEDIVLFEGGTESYKGLMPFSGTYVNLGKNTYLLCNNTRYKNCKFNPYDGYPFPVKIKIECPSNGNQPIDTQVAADLIEQVYQFSRIYWKSVKQQHLPVTIKYPEMLAEIVSHFQGGMMPSQQNNLWFL